MTSIPSPEVKKSPDDSIEKKVYDVVEGLSEYLPIVNDRNRLGFALYKYVMGEGDNPVITVKTAKVKIQGIGLEELADKIAVDIEKIKASK
jgi:hypothetical protein